MRIPLTKYGRPQVIIFPASVICLIAVIYLMARLELLWFWAFVSIEPVLALILIWSLAFFRDPYRLPPLDKNLLLSPADGKITDIETIEENDFIGGPAIRIGIFLSIFNAHINRAPCNAKVEKIMYKKGKHKNAMNPQSGRVNESNDLALIRTDSPTDKLIVRQISGAIARRIVCSAGEGQKLSGGEKFGMIKFGSRTELYVPAHLSSRKKEDTQYAIRNTQYQIKPLVKIGDRVKAGLTPLVKYEIRNTNRESRITNHE